MEQTEELKLQDLLEAGVHFGHQTQRWNPKMRRFIFAERSGIYLIDLQKTLRQLNRAREMIREVVLRGEGVLFVCTKRQLKEIVKTEAQRCGAFWVTERWLGGTLTNFQTIKKQIRRLRELEQGQEDGAFDFFTKKERLKLDREREKLNRNLEGIKSMARIPGAVFVVDSRKERIAIAEANKLEIPIVAIVDTNSDPDPITVPIPGNDDAIRSVSVLTQTIVDEIAAARQQVPERQATEEVESFTYSTDSGAAETDEALARRRVRRKRRPKPEAIVARLKKGEEGGEPEGGADQAQDASGTEEVKDEASPAEEAKDESPPAAEGKNQTPAADDAKEPDQSAGAPGSDKTEAAAETK